MLTENIIQQLPEEDQAMTRSCQAYYLALLRGFRGECLSRLRRQWAQDIEVRWSDSSNLKLSAIQTQGQSAPTIRGVAYYE